MAGKLPAFAAHTSALIALYRAMVPTRTKLAAQAAAQRVKGVKAIALEIEVRYPFERAVQEDELAKRAADALAWGLAPRNGVKITVQKGWVALTGEVEWQYQRIAAESAVRKLEGVTGVTNSVTVKPTVAPKDVRKNILAALHRSAQVEGEGVTVSVKGSAVTLSGHVRTWQERGVVERAAWSAPALPTSKTSSRLKRAVVHPINTDR